MTASKLKDILNPQLLIKQSCDLVATQPAHLRQGIHPDVVHLLRSVLEFSRQHIRAEFEATQKPAPYLKASSGVMDAVLEAAFSAACTALNQPAALVTCIAVGGYGRQELFPHSDIDLLFLIDSTEEKQAKQLAEATLYYLWDTGLTIGHSVRSSDEAIALAREDHTIAAAMLDRRYVCGNRMLFTQLDTRMQSEIIGKDPTAFVEAKLQERAQRHHRQGDSRFFLEPNIKENKGGLRDLHSLHWLACYVYGVRSVSELVKLGVLNEKEYRDFAHAELFLRCVRIYLHLLTGRAEERLTFDMQLRIGELLGFRDSDAHKPVERFMKRYFQVAKTVGDLTRLFCALLEEEHKRPPRISLARLIERAKHIDDFILQGQRLNFPPDIDLSHHPILILKLFHTAQHHDVDIHPRALQLVSRNLKLIDNTLRGDAEANRLFLDMLLSPKGPEVTLRRLNEAGVLGRFIPEFGHVVGQMQYDMYHVFTVDEHTIRALGILHSIERGQLKEELPLATSIIHQVSSRSALYLALLCHDIAKGTGGRHAEKGEKIVRRLAERFGLSSHDAMTASWLVLEHTLCSDIAFKRDLHDARTIGDFVEKVQSPERLRLLLIITVCDIRAVGPQIWNGWKGALLRELYQRAEERMGASTVNAHTGDIALVKSAIESALSDWTGDERQHYFENGFAEFWLAASADHHISLARLLKESRKQPDAIRLEHHIDHFRAITHLMLCLPNHPDLLVHIAGSVATISASIQGAKLFVLRDGTAVALLDIQNIQGKAYDDLSQLKRFRHTLADSLSGKLNLAEAVAAQQQAYRHRTRSMQLPPQLFIDNHSSDTYTLLEVNGTDRIGFLYDVTRALSLLNLSIVTSHITTYGEKAVDVFYIKDMFGLKIVHPDKLAQIRDVIISRLSEENKSLATQAVSGTTNG